MCATIGSWANPVMPHRSTHTNLVHVQASTQVMLTVVHSETMQIRHGYPARKLFSLVAHLLVCELVGQLAHTLKRTTSSPHKRESHRLICNDLFGASVRGGHIAVPQIFMISLRAFRCATTSSCGMRHCLRYQRSSSMMRSWDAAF